ncbi:RNA chaperone Hfq [Clostridium sp. 'deep sea']|uniref:RNA chaperone Hfq n=1 Tax=Clostridium sp. 'deep sea' TaxID=2779445 RepID=UPI0018965820|nr:RNA chaperone Hfq [Clostridium sp. 'deep sea']QOR35772.1 RNA chaperone Hfq [Clostridium sp. 'deep sea']
MSKVGGNLQDTFLNYVRKENIATTIFLTNGYQIRGLVKSFDNFTVLLDVEGKQQMVYKHAVSTIIPSRYVKLYEPDEDEGETDF